MSTTSRPATDRRRDGPVVTDPSRQVRAAGTERDRTVAGTDDAGWVLRETPGRRRPPPRRSPWDGAAPTPWPRWWRRRGWGHDTLGPHHRAYLTADDTSASLDDLAETSYDEELVLGALVVSTLVAIALCAVVVTRWGAPTESVTTATPAPRLALPDAVPANSEYVRSRVMPTGNIRVHHWISSTRPIPRIVLAAPEPSGDGERPVTARDVRVETPAGDREGAEVVDGSPRAYVLGGAEKVHVSYVLSGAVTRSSEGSERALARLTALRLDYPGGRVPRTVVLQGGRLLFATCTADQAAQPRPCGQAEGRSWRVRLEPPQRDELVLARLDLRRAGTGRA